MLDDLIKKYCNDPKNPEINYLVGLEYEKIGQTAAAISFFLRASERTEDTNLAYECTIKIGNAFKKQKGRNYTVKGIYHRAINICPNRPEAYYLLANLENSDNQYFHGYTYANLGLNFSDFDCSPLRTDVGYVGKYGLIYEKSVSSWMWGGNIESRQITRELCDEYWSEMDEWHRQEVERILGTRGLGPESQSYCRYNSVDHSKLRYKFEGSENISQNYSQIYQDIFVLSILDGKKDGTFLEIGGSHPYDNNNTALLESEYFWKGVSVEFDEKMVEFYKKERPDTISICADARELNYKKILSDNFKENTIDYLQLDIEPARNTFEVLLSIPFDEYKFAVITYEHDHYVDVTRTYRDKSRRYLKMMGYELVVSDLSPDGISNFEDWWVHPDLVNQEIIEKMKDVSDQIKNAKEYILTSKPFSQDNFYHEK